MKTADRFQGALLGLWLVPTAVSMMGALSQTGRSSDQNLENLVSDLAETTAFGLEQVQAFLSAPSAFSPMAAGSTRLSSTRLSILLASLPGLLRYHDSRARREQWVSALIAAVSGLADSPAIRAEVLTLGEGLQMAFSPFGERLSDDNGDLIRPFSLLSTLDLTTDYALSVQLAVQQSTEAAAIAGLIAGAWGGRAALPVLWQMQPLRPRSDHNRDPNRQAVIALANRLFAQWAGIRTAALP